MNRTPLFTSLLWTTVGAATAVGCETDEPIAESNGPAAVVPANVEFSVDCGDMTPDPVRFQVINSGNKPLLVRSATATNGFVVTADLPIDVQPGAAISIEVRPPIAEIGTDLGGSTKTGQLTLDTDDPNGASKVELRSRIHGANLVYAGADDKVLSKLTLSSSTSTCPAPVTFFIKNTGDVEAEVTDPGGGNYPISNVSDKNEVAGGGKLEFRISANASSDCEVNGSISYEATGAVCSVTGLLQVTQTVNGTSDVCFCGSSSGA